MNRRLQTLQRRRVRLLEATAAYRDALRACIEDESLDSVMIARAIDVTPHNVRLTALWKEHRGRKGKGDDQAR